MTASDLRVHLDELPAAPVSPRGTPSLPLPAPTLAVAVADVADRLRRLAALRAVCTESSEMLLESRALTQRALVTLWQRLPLGAAQRYTVAAQTDAITPALWAGLSPCPDAPTLTAWATAWAAYREQIVVVRCPDVFVPGGGLRCVRAVGHGGEHRRGRLVWAREGEELPPLDAEHVAPAVEPDGTYPDCGHGLPYERRGGMCYGGCGFCAGASS